MHQFSNNVATCHLHSKRSYSNAKPQEEVIIALVLTEAISAASDCIYWY